MAHINEPRLPLLPTPRGRATVGDAADLFAREEWRPSIGFKVDKVPPNIITRFDHVRREIIRIKAELPAPHTIMVSNIPLGIKLEIVDGEQMVNTCIIKYSIHNPIDTVVIQDLRVIRDFSNVLPVYEHWIGKNGTITAGIVDKSKFVSSIVTKFPDGAKVIGKLKAGQLHEQAVYTYPNGDILTGTMKKGLFQGKCTLTTQGGLNITGTMKKGLFQGEAVYTYPDGVQARGTMVDNKFQPSCTVTLPNGDQYPGLMAEGAALSVIMYEPGRSVREEVPETSADQDLG